MGIEMKKKEFDKMFEELKKETINVMITDALRDKLWRRIKKMLRKE
jgi:hypothetical protein